MSKFKHLLILESLGSVEIKKDGNNDYIFEGIFGEIGVKNRNGRIYDENQYVPQIKNLQEKISQGALLGELDHPEKFEVSLQKASHVIESLEYDKDKKQVIGRIKLLDTRMGRDAKALVDGNVPLHISSRAAGVVESNGHVTIKQLFTYDLVADPGFANAQLTKVNESFGLADDDKIQIFEVDDTFFCDTYTKENNSNNMDSEHVNAEEFDKWSKYMSEELTKLKDSYTALKESVDSKKVEESNNDSKELVELKEYVKYLGSNVNQLANHNNYIIKGLNEVNKTSQINSKYSGYLRENMINIIKFTNHIREKANISLNYSTYLGEELGKSIKYIEHVATGANEIKKYAKYLGVTTNEMANYSKYLGITTNEMANYTQYLKGNVELIGNYSNYLGETMKTGTNKIDESKKSIETKIKEEKSFKDDINSKLQQIIESAEKQKAEDNLHFMKFLPKNTQDEFHSLDAEKQGKVLEAFGTKQYFNVEQATEIYNNALKEQKNDGLDFVRNMPDEYRESFEKLTEARKQQIIAESVYHNLNTPYQVLNFWQTRDLRENTLNLEKIDESIKTPVKPGDKILDSEFAKSIIEKTKQLSGKY